MGLTIWFSRSSGNTGESGGKREEKGKREENLFQNIQNF